jgi:Flp pilus assembly protein CpaB
MRRNVLSRLRLGHIIMALTALLALLLNLAVLRGNQDTVEVAVAASDISAGTTLSMSHFTLSDVPADDVLTARLVAGDEVNRAVGQLATRSIGAGEPILESDLLVVENQEGLRAMSIPIDQTQAVGGNVTAGDSVDVVLVLDGVATYVAVDVQVLVVPGTGTNALGARAGYAPTVAVDAEQVLRIAAALDSGTVHIIRSTGSALPNLEQATAITTESAEGDSG